VHQIACGAELGVRQRLPLEHARQGLASAADLFTQLGPNVPVQVVAQQAGVGVATIYRHFPTKSLLIDAVVRVRLPVCAERTCNSSH
jgi:AcrR family transcriptional regulator